MKLTVDGVAYEVKEPSRAVKREIALAWSGVFNLRTNYFDAEGTKRLIELVEKHLIGDEEHPVYQLAPRAQVDALREIGRLVAEGLTGEERPD